MAEVGMFELLRQAFHRGRMHERYPDRELVLDLLSNRLHWRPPFPTRQTGESIAGEFEKGKIDE